MKIFILEDFDVIHDILTEELNRIKGIQICGMTDDPTLAMRMIQETAPELIILDVVLCNGNGIEMLRKIRDKGPGCNIIILTNHPYHHYRQISRELGADLFFDKTIEFEKAIEAVRNISSNVIRSSECHESGHSL